MRGAELRRPQFEDPDLQHAIMRLRRVDNTTNLLYLLREYLCLSLVIGLAVLFSEHRSGWGMSWWWNLPVFGLAIVLVGALQHRLAGLGHEASHYTFLKHRLFNDLIPDLFCMFPILTCVHFYRVFHMAHHQFTNDPHRDPDLLNLGHGKRAFEFPMSRGRFVAKVYFCMVLAPLRFLQFQMANVLVNALGKGRSVYKGTKRGGHFGELYLPRVATILGIAYVLVVVAVTRLLADEGRPGWISPAAMMAWLAGVAVLSALPEWAVFVSPFRQAYSCRVASALRLGYYSLLAAALAGIRSESAGQSFVYPLLLWFVPLISSFPFFMLLRDVYQHSNADAGRLTNSRVFFTDWFTRWAVFVYGQDMHIPHHLFPTVPHYRLEELHSVMRSSSADYQALVVECHGTFRDPLGRTTILDELTRPRSEGQRGGPSLAPRSSRETTVS
jgi:fatty acid desaturase